MAIILPIKGIYPSYPDNIFIAPNATIIGDVVIGKGSSIWFNAVLRGDVNSIRIGANTNIQDNVVIHCTFEKTQTTVGDNVTVGHRAILHGCQIDDNVLIGMGAIVMDNVKVGSDSIIGAGAVVLENTIIPPGSIYVGNPAHRVKQIIPDLIDEKIKKVANNYDLYSSWYMERL